MSHVNEQQGSPDSIEDSDGPPMALERALGGVLPAPEAEEFRTYIEAEIRRGFPTAAVTVARTWDSAGNDDYLIRCGLAFIGLQTIPVELFNDPPALAAIQPGLSREMRDTLGRVLREAADSAERAE